MTTDQNVATITEFVDAWSRLVPEELASFFTEDGCYHNIPVGPVFGRDNIRQMITAFTASWTATQWDLLNIVGAGDIEGDPVVGPVAMRLGVGCWFSMRRRTRLG